MYSREDALIDLWLSGKSPGQTNVGRLLNLAVILAIRNRRDELKYVLLELDQAASVLPSRYAVDLKVTKLKQEFKIDD